MGTPRWTPEAGTRALVERLGATPARTLLGHLAAGRVRTAAMVDSPYAEVIGCIGRCDAMVFLRDGAAEHLASWPRSWAARSLGLLGDEDAAARLVDAFADRPSSTPSPRPYSKRRRSSERAGLERHGRRRNRGLRLDSPFETAIAIVHDVIVVLLDHGPNEGNLPNRLNTGLDVATSQ